MSTGAPVTAIVDGRTIEYTDVQRCSVTPEEVHAEASDESFNLGRVDWLARDADETVIAIQTPPPLMILRAGAEFPDTTAQVTVDGSRAEVRARVFDQISNELKDIVIQVDCAQGGGGEPEFTGTVTVAVGGQTFMLDALDDCRFTEDGIRVSKLAGDDGIAFTVQPEPGPGHTVQLIAKGQGWVRGPGFISDQLGLEFEISGQRATWSGLLTPQFGDDQPAAITIDCA